MTGNWLRASVMGANDGLLSTSSLMMGMAATQQTPHAILIAGISALLAGAMAMAAGEYVSVSSERDSVEAQIKEEEMKVRFHKEDESLELIEIYIAKGLPRDLAEDVAGVLMDNDPLGAHIRDDLGITDVEQNNPFLAALASAISFSLGALIPILTTLVSFGHPVMALWCSTMMGLIILGGVGSRLSNNPAHVGISRVFFWGVLSLGLTSLLGAT